MDMREVFCVERTEEEGKREKCESEAVDYCYGDEDGDDGFGGVGLLHGEFSYPVQGEGEGRASTVVCIPLSFL